MLNAPASRSDRTAWQQRARQEAVARYRDVADEDTVAACFDAAVLAHADSRVTDYLPVLVERRLREVLGDPRRAGALPRQRADRPEPVATA